MIMRVLKSVVSRCGLVRIPRSYELVVLPCLLHQSSDIFQFGHVYLVSDDRAAGLII